MNHVHDIHFLPLPLPGPGTCSMPSLRLQPDVWRTAAFIRLRYSTVLEFGTVVRLVPPSPFILESYLPVHYHRIFEPVDYCWLSNDRTTGTSIPVVRCSSILANYDTFLRLGWVGFRLTMHEVHKHDRSLCPFPRVPRQFSRHILYHKVGI